MDLKTAKKFVGKKLFYRSRKKGSGVVVELKKILANRRCLVRHLNQGNDFECSIHDLLTECPHPMGMATGALQNIEGLEIVGVVVKIDDYHATLSYWPTEEKVTEWAVGEVADPEYYDDVGAGLERLLEIQDNVRTEVDDDDEG